MPLRHNLTEEKERMDFAGREVRDVTDVRLNTGTQPQSTNIQRGPSLRRHNEA
jgi:hypothetical protein